MEATKAETVPSASATGQNLMDESFMSAAQLRSYMTEIEMSKAEKEVSGMSRADKAREEMLRSLIAPIELTPERKKQIAKTLLHKLRSAAERGETELLVMRFPSDLCTDKGRAINNSEEGWPDTLQGRPRQAYELWRDHLREAGYALKAMIVDWPRGLPGDVGFFLSWGRDTH